MSCGDRDNRGVEHAVARGMKRAAAGRSAHRLFADSSAAGVSGARRLATPADLAPSRDDEVASIEVPGRYVPLRFARYYAPEIDPSHFQYYRVSGWRVAVPRAVTGSSLKDLLYRVFYFGPASAGYVRYGDTLVPATLGPGDRTAVANYSGEFYGYPLTA
jgi:hypothetical protein